MLSFIDKLKGFENIFPNADGENVGNNDNNNNIFLEEYVCVVHRLLIQE